MKAAARAEWVAGIKVESDGRMRTALLETDGRSVLGLGPSVAGAVDPTGPLEPQLAALLAQLPGWSLAGVLLPEGTVLEGEALARLTGQSIAWDFAAEAAFGKEPDGAFFLHGLARHLGYLFPVAFLSLGPIAKLTWVDPSRSDPADPLSCLSFDAGPGVSLAEATLAESGAIAGDAPERMLADPFFAAPLPRRLRDPERFDPLTRDLSPEDAATTRAALAAIAALHGLQLCPAPITELLLYGPAEGHGAVRKFLEAGLEIRPKLVRDLEVDAAALGAYDAAFLAIRSLIGFPTTYGGSGEARAAIGGARFAADRPSCAKVRPGGLASAIIRPAY